MIDDPGVKRALELTEEAVAAQVELPDSEIRSRFELWAARTNLSLKRKGDGYAGPYTNWTWEAFYAGTRSALAAALPSPQPESAAPRFKDVSCSQCGQSFGPGNHGYSHCKDHRERPKEKHSEGAKTVFGYLHHDGIVEAVWCVRYSDHVAALQSANAPLELRDMVLEEAARACSAFAWSHPNAHLLGPEQNRLQCAEQIRLLKKAALDGGGQSGAASTCSKEKT